MKNRYLSVNLCGAFCLLTLLLSCSSYTPFSRDLPARSDSSVIAFVKQHHIPYSCENRALLLNGGHQKFEALFRDIRAARHSVHLEYFNFRNDSITDALLNLLAQKVKEGVEVRAMFDAFGNFSNNRPLRNKKLDEIRSRGIEIVKFDPLRFPYLNHTATRDHRKIVVIDGRIAYTGGINVADYYLQGLPGIGSWRDMHVRIEGEAASAFQDIFLAMWNNETGEKIGGPAYYPPVADSLARDTTCIAVVDRCPRKNPKMMRQMYARSIDAAKKKIQIVNPYFLPTHTVRAALYRALKDSVEVEIMLSSKCDIPFTPDGVRYVAHKLMKRGAKIYYFDEGFHHSKVMMVDSLFSTVGSTNLNSRSLRYDYEINAFFFDGNTTHELSRIFEQDKKECHLMTPESWKKLSLWKKFCGWAANLLTPFM